MIIDTNYNNGDVAQLGEHFACTEGVVGSNPIISTNNSVAQLVEHRPFKARVVGSNPTGITMVVEDSDKTAEACATGYDQI